MTQPPTLITLPEHVLCHIAAYIQRECDETQIWRLRRVCRVFKEAADWAIKPSLSRVEVTARPRLAYDLFKPISDELLGETEHSRREALQTLDRRFRDHLVTYRAERTTITRLKVEMRDDDPISGWGLLEDHAGTLEEAEIQVWDRLWALDQESTLERYRDRQEDYGSVSEEGDALGLWTYMFRGVRFPNLTTLTLVTTARLPDHLLGVLPLVPNLQALTLSCHWSPVYFEYEPIDYTGQIQNLPPNLERLTIHGDEANVGDILQNVLPLADSIRFLVVHISEFAPLPDLEGILDMIAQHRPLVGLALYGPNLPYAMRSLRRVQEEDAYLTLPNLTTLVLEQIPMDRDELSSPLLDDAEEDRPSLPALRFLSFVDRKPIPRYRSGSVSSDDSIYYDVYDHRAVRQVATRYPNLCVTQWSSGTPIDPFDLNYTFEGGREKVKIRLVWKAGEDPCPGQDE